MKNDTISTMDISSELALIYSFILHLRLYFPN